jgi:hypothetical protein
MKSTTQEVTTTQNNRPTKYQWKGNKKQKQAMEAWLSPMSETFGNAYKSFKNAGFSESYSKNIVGQAPKWISEYLDRTNFTDEHVLAALQDIATGRNLDSRSPADTQVKALEIIGKIKGMIDNKQGTTVNIVQPILGGESVRAKEVIDQ